ncbi:hypothetical protein HPB49_024799 [Dermacentor silvarum]|uniref:Uncharacterized protein n=1 Tax=Dermacentor silvarum TaxID=543639 RepID=A0ACB8D8T6_DERSI|nr:hypothetical protein HPB49_024799 [Dermacentor silvarum]
MATSRAGLLLVCAAAVVSSAHDVTTTDDSFRNRNAAVEGNIEGFVDLGHHTASYHKGVLADHGMVVLFQPHTGSAVHLRSSTKHHLDPKRQLFFVSDFPHLLKNLRKGFVSKGYLTRSGYVHSGIIETAWESDRDNVTLKAMPNITSAHLKPNSLEKMTVV